MLPVGVECVEERLERGAGVSREMTLKLTRIGTLAALCKVMQLSTSMPTTTLLGLVGRYSVPLSTLCARRSSFKADLLCETAYVNV